MDPRRGELEYFQTFVSESKNLDKKSSDLAKLRSCYLLDVRDGEATTFGIHEEGSWTTERLADMELA